MADVSGVFGDNGTCDPTGELVWVQVTYPVLKVLARLVV